jgi:hypothetical protein
MPALRRLLAYISPYCFGSTKSDSKYEQYNTPNKLSNGISNGVSRNSRMGLRSSGTSKSGITKTINTQIETKVKEDDEIELVQVLGK